MSAEKISVINAPGQVQLLSGVVESDGEIYRIHTQNGLYDATRAFSCLVEPRQNDTVLFSVDARQHCHILSIVERPGANDASLAFPGDVNLKTDSGGLSIQARRGINMLSGEGINQVAESYALAAKKALVNADDLTAVGSTLVAKVRHIRTIANRVETVADHWLQKLRNSLRQVEGVDQLKTRDSIHTIKNLYSMRSRQAAILAKNDIKVDAERIHMG